MVERIRPKPSAPPRTAWTLVVVTCLAVLAVVIPRDLAMEKQYTGDLRNRIVGARLIHDGRSPYFYKWKPGDGTRYYDPANFDSLRSSNITSTPFFHHLLAPLAGLPQSGASKVWLLIEYLMFIGSVALAFSITATPVQKWVVLIFSALFMLTSAWKAHIALGQVYICIPFLALTFLWLLLREKTMVYAMLAATAGASLILIKPNTLLFFIPFVLLLLRFPQMFPRRWLIAFCIPPLLLTAWIAGNSRERNLWQDYREGMTEQIRMHQHLHPALQQNAPDPHFPEFEGIDQQAVARLEAQQPLSLFSENGNVFVLVEKVFHFTPSIAALSMTAILIILALSALYFIRLRHTFHTDAVSATLQRAAIIGFCLYMVSDLFSPVYRHQYYTVQWLCPLLIAAAMCTPRLRRYYILLLIGIALNILHLNFIKMGHSLGEYLLLLTLLGICLLPPGQSGSVERRRTILTSNP